MARPITKPSGTKKGGKTAPRKNAAPATRNMRTTKRTTAKRPAGCT